MVFNLNNLNCACNCITLGCAIYGIHLRYYILSVVHLLFFSFIGSGDMDANVIDGYDYMEYRLDYDKWDEEYYQIPMTSFVFSFENYF